MPTENHSNTGSHRNSPRERWGVWRVRWWVWPGLALLLVLAISRQGGVLRLLRGEDPVLARVRRSGVLRVGMDANYPPFEWVDEQGLFHGFDVELAEALAERLGVKAQFVSVHFDGLYDALRAEKFDMIVSALPYDQTMTQDLRYSETYFDAGLVLLAHQGAPSVETLSQLDGVRLAVELGSEGHLQARLLQEHKGLSLELVVLRDERQVPDALAADRVDYAICDRVAAYRYLTENQELMLVGPPLTQDPYVIATLPKADQLMVVVNGALGDWRQAGTLAQWEARWLGGATVSAMP